MQRLAAVLVFFILAQDSILQSNEEAQIIQYEYNNDGKGNYNFSFRTSNNIIRTETGTVKDEGLPSQYIHVTGKVSYIKPDGEKESWTYTADKNGYRTQNIEVNIPPMFIHASPALPPGVVASLLGK